MQGFCSKLLMNDLFGIIGNYLIHCYDLEKKKKKKKKVHTFYNVAKSVSRKLL